MGDHPAAVAEGLAKSLTVNINGKPVNLLSQPGIAKGIEALKDKEIERAWQAEYHGRTREKDNGRANKRFATLCRRGRPTVPKTTTSHGKRSSASCASAPMKPIPNL